MRLRYHQLVGMRVVAADGKEVGRVADLEAEPRGGRLQVTGLLVGPVALLQRIAFRHWPGLAVLPARTIPWEWVARVDDRIHLRVESAEIAQSEASAAIPLPAKEAAEETGR